MDGSITRRGQPCWYKVPNVGMVAINDSFLLESLIYKVIKRHFRSEPHYLSLVELFHEVTYQTELGQLMDLITAPEDHVDLNRFSLEKYVSCFFPATDAADTRILSNTRPRTIPSTCL
jgi:farnesyl diphosphate synthase